MEILFIILSTSFIIWLFVYESFYSPKARIRRLWGEIHKISFKIGEERRMDGGVADNIIIDIYQEQIHRKQKLINALLDYYFDQEEDEEYIEENKAEI